MDPKKAQVKLGDEVIVDYIGLDVVSTLAFNDKILSGIINVSPSVYTQEITFVISGISFYTVFILNTLMHMQPRLFTGDIPPQYWNQQLVPMIARLSVIAFPDTSEAMPMILADIIKFRSGNGLNLNWILDLKMTEFTKKIVYASSILGLNLSVTIDYLGHLEDFIKIKRGGFETKKIIYSSSQKMFDEFWAINPFKNAT